MKIDKIYLASKSPRRHELLKQIGVDFEVLLIDIPEEVADNESPEDYSYRISIDKANHAWDYLIKNNLPLYPVLSADTDVVKNGIVYGKPQDYDDAFKMWKEWHNSSHDVITSISLKYHNWQKTVLHKSTVYFDEFTDDEIRSYLDTGDYKDKSGSYGIHNSSKFIKSINGSFDSIMGLPLNEVRKLLLVLQQEV